MSVATCTGCKNDKFLLGRNHHVHEWPFLPRTLADAVAMAEFKKFVALQLYCPSSFFVTLAIVKVPFENNL